MRGVLQRDDLFHLQLDIGIDLVVGEDIALGQVRTVGAEALERLAQRCADGRDLGQFLGRQVVQVLVHGIARMDLVLDAVEAGHQHRREGQVRVRGGVRETDLDALAVRRVHVRDPAGSRAVARGVGQKHRCLITRDQALVAVGRRVGEGVQRLGVLDDAADVEQGHFRQVGILVAREERLAVLPDRLVHMHARAVVAGDRLRQESGGQAVGRCDLMHAVLVELQVVGGLDEGAELHAELVLRRCHLVVVLLDRNAHVGHDREHFAADVLAAVDRRDRKVAALDARTMAEVALFIIAGAVVRALDGIDGVHGAVHRHVDLHIFENEEFGFRAEEGGVAEAGGFHVGQGCLGGAARVARIGLAGARLEDVAEQRQGRLREERVDIAAIQVGHQRHVGFVDGLPAGDRRAVEHEAFGEALFIDGVDMLGHVLHLAARVGETEVDIGDVVLLDHFHDGFCVRHGGSFHSSWGRLD